MWNIKTEQYVEIPADKLREAISGAYNLSAPRGMGFLHSKSGPLDDATIDQIMATGERRQGISMDYVHGRCCKFHTYAVDGRHYTSPRWYDHSTADLIDLLAHVGVENPEAKIEAAREAALAG